MLGWKDQQPCDNGPQLYQNHSTIPDVDDSVFIPPTTSIMTTSITTTSTASTTASVTATSASVTASVSLCHPLCQCDKCSQLRNKVASLKRPL